MDSKLINDILSEALDTLPRITMGDLYVRCKDIIGDTKPNDFRLLVSKWISDSTIPGYESRKGPFGGIYKKNSPNDKSKSDKKLSESSDDVLTNKDEDLESDGTFTIQIAPTLRIVQSDDRNWAIQKKSGETWISKCYHGELSGMLKSAAKHISNGEYKLSSSTVVQLNELYKVVKGMEERLVGKLQEVIENAASKK